MRLAAAALILSLAWGPSAGATVPALGTRDGELLCAGLMRVMISGALLTTGGDPLTSAKWYAFFLGRLSVIAPEAVVRLDAFDEAYEKLTPAEQDELVGNCFEKLKQIDPAVAGPPKSDH